MKKMIGIMIIALAVALTFIACDDGNGDDGGGGTPPPTFTSIDDLGTYLSEQENNTADTPYKVKLNVSDITGIGTMLKNNTMSGPSPEKYVSLDLSSSTITSIGGQAFYECRSLTSVIIPNSVTSIGNNAFSTCDSLTSITIPNGVTSVGAGAFSNCAKLASVNIPASVTSIGEGAFNSPNLAIRLDPNNQNFAFQDGILYNKAKTQMIFISRTISGAVTIPDSVESIGQGAFRNCTSLTSVIIGSGVTSIGDGAFVGCTSLISITISDSVTSIGSEAFNGCTKLASITIGSGVTSIGEAAFMGCTSLISITIPASVTSIGSSAFSNCTGLTSITFQGTISSSGVSEYTFSGIGDLRTKYLAGGIGTYTTTTPVPTNPWDWEPVWTKQ